MNSLLAEFLGTSILVTLGNGVVANVVLSKTKGHGAGLIVIALGWAMAVFVGAMCSKEYSGAHLNPALTIASVVVGNLPVLTAAGYIVAQMLGGMCGAYLVYLHYRSHFMETTDANDQLACFCTAPNLPGNSQAFFCEAFATCLLILPIFLMANPGLEHVPSTGTGVPTIGLGAIGILPVALIVFAIGVSLGGTTGYAINPARDLGPRLVHHLLSMPNKRDSDWSYAWIPVAGPILGGLVAALIFLIVV